MSQLFPAILPWTMGDLTLAEYIGLHKYREALEHQE